MINVFMGILLYLNYACQTPVQFVYVHSLCAIRRNINTCQNMKKKLTTIFHNPADRGHCSWAVDGRKHKMACTFSDE